MKKGFTLIELIAVIVIIALIGLITVPMIVGVLNNSRQKMFITNVKELISIAEQDVTENSRNCNYDDNTSYLYELSYDNDKNIFKFGNEKINFSGTIVKGSGKIIIDKDGKVNKVNIWNGDIKKCAIFYDDRVLVIENINNKNECQKAKYNGNLFN